MTNTISCSDGSIAAGERLAGSAPNAVAWVALEQSGPWGPKALTDSHLDKDLGRAIEAVAATHHTRASLIRRPGRHPDTTWLLVAELDSPEQVLLLDWAALQRGDLESVRRSLPALERSFRSHLLVCTNGTRDVCCATKGRPVAIGLAKQFTENVWEVTHTSGHRLAPTTVLLPAGTLHGRLDIEAAAGVLRAAERGDTVLRGSRGRSTWPAAAQVAELAVRDETGETSLTALAVTAHTETAPQDWVTEVRHVDGRTWQVHTTARASDIRRAESCGKALTPMTYYVTALTPLPR